MKPHLEILTNRDVFYRCVEDCNESIMISDKTGKLLYVNPTWQRTYGYTREEALGNTPRLLHSGHQPEAFYKQMWEQIKTVGHWKGELINRAKNGQLIPVLLTITPFNSENGEFEGYMGIALDISQRKELEAKIVHQDRLASIGMLASGLAHEVGTPLGVVRGRAEFLMMKADSPTFKKDLEVIVSQIDRISKLIKSLLRVGRNFGETRMEDIDLAHATNEILSLVGQNLRQDSVQIRVEIPEGLRAKADFSRMEQVLLNLIMNSIHAIQKAISEGRTEGNFLKISASKRHKKVALEIEDSGCGIPPENINKLFKPFFTTKDIGQGTGLGLAIVAQLVHEMRGEISVRSRVNQGTTFSIVLDA